MNVEVGASGHVELGEEFAGCTFQVVRHSDGRLELIPTNPGPCNYSPPDADGWLAPGGYSNASPWAVENREALEEYAARIEQHGTAAEQMQRYLAENPLVRDDENGQV